MDINSIINKNSDKDFIRRIIHSGSSPKIKNPDGSVSTHLMAWGDHGGKYIVYPEIVYDGKSLRKLRSDDAMDYAIKRGEYLEFDSPEDADFFSQHYKEYTPPEPKKMPPPEMDKRMLSMMMGMMKGGGR